MKLYHFTSPLHVEGCCKEGITKGSIPLIINSEYKLLFGWQWLTSNPAFHQEWANNKYSTLPYDRTAYRLTVNIPKTSRDKLFRWLEICKKLPVPEELNILGDPENWWIFNGRIKPAWIKEVVKKGECENGRAETL